jgi:5-methylcytosine-specific restriction endonuclease McrA
MLRRRRRVRSSNPFKPRYATRRQRRRETYAKARPVVRERAWQRFGGRCVFPTCRVGLTLDAMHGHEVTFRSAGGDATDLDEVVPACATCHGHIHVRVGGKLKRITHREDGGLDFYARPTGNDEWRKVGQLRFVEGRPVYLGRDEWRQ